VLCVSIALYMSALHGTARVATLLLTSLLAWLLATESSLQERPLVPSVTAVTRRIALYRCLGLVGGPTGRALPLKEIERVDLLWLR